VLTLGITTSTDVVGVALGSDGEVLSSKSLETDRRHAEELMPMIIEVLAIAGSRMSDLGQLAVDVGPGRFTGLRVGLATIRTLAFALDLEIVPVSSLELLALGSGMTEVVSVIDARRDEVFQQRYSNGEAQGAAVVGSPADLVKSLPHDIYAAGDGANRYSDFYENRVGESNPSARLLVTLAHGRPALPGPKVMPRYMREPDVQINIKTRAKK
jgi:tRNA threonylcarbamoyladenosine biosynthesis protein TsaB